MANSVGQFVKDVQFLSDPAIFYQADEFRAPFDMWTAGVRSGGSSSGQQIGSFAVFPSAGMTVNIGMGVAIIEGGTAGTENTYSGLTTSGMYMVEMTDSGTTLTLGAASATLTRNDLICLRVFDSPGSGAGASNEMRIIVVAGTPGAGDPAVPSNSLVLSRIVVTANKTSIVASDIADLRTLSVPASLPGFFAANGYPLPAGSGTGGGAGPVVTNVGGVVTVGGTQLVTQPYFDNWVANYFSPLAQRVSNLEVASGGALGTTIASTYGVIAAGTSAWAPGPPTPGLTSAMTISYAGARSGWLPGLAVVSLTIRGTFGITVTLNNPPTLNLDAAGNASGSFTAMVSNTSTSNKNWPAANDPYALQWVVFGARQDKIVI